MGRRVDLVLGVLNGAVGDHLVQTDNGLATPMEFFQDGAPLVLNPTALATTFPNATGRLVVLVHGLMCNEDIWRAPDGGSYGSWLARDVGVTPLYLRYNSGRPIADNGADLHALLQRLVDAWPLPVTELLLLGYSMGGLVVRSACHMGHQDHARWLPLVQRIIYVGTPHHGAPLERFGRVLSRVLTAVDDPYTRLISQVLDLRSDGVKDLGDADLTHQDRARREVRWSLRDPAHPVPLLDGIQHLLVAGALSADPVLQALFGDAIVPVSSGSGVRVSRLPLPPEHVHILHGISHLGLAHHPRVYDVMKRWLTETHQ